MCVPATLFQKNWQLLDRRIMAKENPEYKYEKMRMLDILQQNPLKGLVSRMMKIADRKLNAKCN